MRTLREPGSRFTSMFFLGLLTVVLAVACRPTAERPDTTGAAALLAEIVEDVWQYTLETSPLVRQDEGLPVERLWDFSYAAAQRDDEHRREILDRLARIDTEKLEGEDVLTWEILEWELQTAREGHQYFWHWSYLTPYATPTRAIRPFFGALAVAAAEDREGYLALLRQVPGVVRDLEDVVRGQVERGIVASREALPNILGLIGSFNQSPEKSLFYVADRRFSGSGVDEATIHAFRAQVASIIEQEVNPAWQRLHDYVSGDYQGLAFDGVGLSRYPDGAAYYRHLTRRFTTFDVSPEEVQRIGFEIIAEMEGQMDEIQREVGFEGTREAFRTYLRTDRQFFSKTPEEVAERIRSAADAFYARIDEFFLKKPRAPYGVRRLDPALEGSMTYGYYDAPTANEPSGFYNFNGSRLDQRSSLNLEGVAYHELIPGHHFQVARQRENEDMPAFRRYMHPTAYSEGWGSYSTLLGLEAGFLDDPYSRYGVFVLEVFLANRLVVDPGMNTFGWPLEKARLYMREHTVESETQIATETLRYGADRPGQALAYQMGKLKIVDLRRRAQEALGERFDIRKFHETIVGSGAMPLAVLEKHVERFVERELTES